MGYFNDSGIKSRHWAIPMMASILILALAVYYESEMVPWLSWTLYGSGIILSVWSGVNLLILAAGVIVRGISELRQAGYKLSGNYLADQIREMSSEQLQTLRLYGSTVIQYLIDDDPAASPIEIIYGTEVSLAFAAYFLSRSSERQTCPVRDFMDGTYHWDWTGENRIEDRRQAKQFTGWLISQGFAEFKGGNMSATWKEYRTDHGDTHHWSPDKVLSRLGMEAINDEK